MREQTTGVLLTRIRRGAIDLVLQPNTHDLWRLPHVDVRNDTRSHSQILEWLSCALPWSAYAKLGEVQDTLAPERVVHIFQVHDTDTENVPRPFEWFEMQKLPALAFMNEQRLLQEHTRRITECVIAHQNPYKLVPGFR